MNRTLMVLAAAMLAATCGGRSEIEKASTVLDAPVYVDVRSAAEYAQGHVRGAINIAHDQMELRYTELEKYRDQRIILYCRSGRRSTSALAVLNSKGFTRAENGGSFDGLIAAGVPYE